MEIVPVFEPLENVGLSEPELHSLVPDGLNYEVLLFQPKGDIEINPLLKNRNSELAGKQFGQFIEYVESLNVDLAVTPEYSMPWDVVFKYLENEHRPNLGKLWVFGCESITLSQLKQIEEQLKDKVTFIYENIESREDKFVSPLVYLFQAPEKHNHANYRMVAIVQFKNYPMSDADRYEADGLNLGSVVYGFGFNSSESVRLISLICSDTFIFSEENARSVYNNGLILSIQMNKDPRHDTFISCRHDLLKYQGDKTEIICLNWASDIVMDNENWKNISGSAWYLKSTECDTRDNILIRNHKRGLYYTWHQSNHAHSLFFNYDPLIFHVVATKVTHIGVPGVGPKRVGPKLLRTYEWHVINDSWSEIESIDDKFCDLVNEFGLVKDKLVPISISNPIEVERILALSTGSVISSNWFEVQQLDSCVIGNDEILKRVTFAQDTHPNAINFRRDRLKRFKTLCEIVTDEKLPPSVSINQDDYSFCWSKERPNQNLHMGNGEFATIVYVGDQPSINELDTISQIIAGNLQRGFDEPDESYHARQKLAVLYRNSENEIVIYDRFRKYAKIDQDPTESEFDIGRKE
ncbi:hypothetical protein ACFLXY_06420 [Chloroflexota bacterium]